MEKPNEYEKFQRNCFDQIDGLNELDRQIVLDEFVTWCVKSHENVREAVKDKAKLQDLVRRFQQSRNQ